MSQITRADIEAAVYRATGNPTTGDVAAVQPLLIAEIWRLIDPPKDAAENRIVQAKETRTA